MKALKQQYLDLVERHGEDVTELRQFRRELLELNRRHRREAMTMYARMIAKIQKTIRGGRRPR
jgi:hypothetical protein